ncbi:MAG: hypothetical protein ACYC54_15040 [Sedimentisphaerales bacterium]
MFQFKCFNCGSDELSYEKWIKEREAVLIQPDTGFITYIDQQIDDTNVLPAECRFICQTCKKPVLFHGSDIQTEAELTDYFGFTVDQRAEMQAEFEAQQEQEAQNEEYHLSDDEGTIDSDTEN